MSVRPLIIWLIDDSETNHHVAHQTIAKLPGVTLQSFYTGSEAIAEFCAIEAGSDSEKRAPKVVLMDYYLDGERGDHITRALRACERLSRPTIIGYSSVASASEAIVRAGADLIVRKHANDAGINPSLAAWLKTHC